MVSSLSVVAEVVAANNTRAAYTGADDLLAKFGLNRLYGPATTMPPSNPYLKLKQAGDRRLFKSERWALSGVVDWPEHHYHWRDFSQQELRRAFPLGPASFDIQEEERGVLVAGPAGRETHTPTASEGPSEASARPRKIKIKTAGMAKRARPQSTEPQGAGAETAAGQAVSKKARAGS